MASGVLACWMSRKQIKRFLKKDIVVYVTFIWELPLPRALNIILTWPQVKYTSMCLFLIATLLICGAHQYATKHLAHKHCRIFFV